MRLQNHLTHTETAAEQPAHTLTRPCLLVEALAVPRNVALVGATDRPGSCYRF
jgi:hypothetical protein